MLNHRLVCGENNTISLWTRSSSIAVFFVLFCFFFSTLSLSFSNFPGIFLVFLAPNGEGNEVGFETFIIALQTQSYLREVWCLNSLIGSRFSPFLLWFNQNFFSPRRDSHTTSCRSRAKNRVPCCFSTNSTASFFCFSWKWKSYIWDWWGNFLSSYFLIVSRHPWMRKGEFIFFSSIIYIFYIFWFNSLFLLFRN